MEIDKQGYVINPGDKRKINKEYQGAIKTIIKSATSFFGDRIYSIYVRGSVSAGNAAYKYSDLDMVCILKNNVDIADFMFGRKQCIAIEKTFNFIKFMDLMIISYDDLLYSTKFNQLRINIKTLSCCIYGKDITSLLPSIKVGEELFLYLYKDIPAYLVRLKRFFYEEGRTFHYLYRKKNMKIVCRWIMRTILRSSLGLVMLQKKVYSPNVKICYKEFTDMFPEFKDDMAEALKLEYYPINNKKKINNFLNKFLPKYIGLYQKHLEKVLH